MRECEVEEVSGDKIRQSKERMADLKQLSRLESSPPKRLSDK